VTFLNAIIQISLALHLRHACGLLCGFGSISKMFTFAVFFKSFIITIYNAVALIREGSPSATVYVRLSEKSNVSMHAFHFLLHSCSWFLCFLCVLFLAFCSAFTLLCLAFHMLGIG